MVLWGTVEPVRRIWRFGGQLNLLNDMAIWRTVQPVEQIRRFGRQLDLLNGYSVLEDILTC